MTIKLGYEASRSEMNLDKIEIVGEALDEIRMRLRRPILEILLYD